MVLIIDNYDGSANNIYQLIGQIEPNTVILHHDQIEPSQVLTMAPSHIVLSSGSGTPRAGGICRGNCPCVRGTDSDSWNLPGVPNYLRCIWRENHIDGAGRAGEAKTRSCGVP